MAAGKRPVCRTVGAGLERLAERDRRTSTWAPKGVWRTRCSMRSRCASPESTPAGTRRLTTARAWPCTAAVTCETGGQSMARTVAAGRAQSMSATPAPRPQSGSTPVEQPGVLAEPLRVERRALPDAVVVQAVDRWSRPSRRAGWPEPSGAPAGRRAPLPRTCPEWAGRSMVRTVTSTLPVPRSEVVSVGHARARRFPCRRARGRRTAPGRAARGPAPRCPPLDCSSEPSHSTATPTGQRPQTSSHRPQREQAGDEVALAVGGPAPEPPPAHARSAPRAASTRRAGSPAGTTS